MWTPGRWSQVSKDIDKHGIWVQKSDKTQNQGPPRVEGAESTKTSVRAVGVGKGPRTFLSHQCARPVLAGLHTLSNSILSSASPHGRHSFFISQMTDRALQKSSKSPRSSRAKPWAPSDLSFGLPRCCVIRKKSVPWTEGPWDHALHPKWLWFLLRYCSGLGTQEALAQALTSCGFPHSLILWSTKPSEPLFIMWKLRGQA